MHVSFFLLPIKQSGHHLRTRIVTVCLTSEDQFLFINRVLNYDISATNGPYSLLL